MRKSLAALLLYLGLASAALAQSAFTMPPPGGVTVVGVQVVATCGSAAGLSANNVAYLAMNTSGQLCTNASGGSGGTVNQGTPNAGGANAWSVIQTEPNTAAVTNPTSTLTLPATTTAYLPLQLIANNATAGSVVVPSFAIANSAGGARISRLRLTSNDSTSTGWPGQSIQIDLWSAAPTFTNGDRGTYAVATGSAKYLGSFSGTLSAVAGDGVYAILASTVGDALYLKLASGTSVFWTMQSLTGSGVTGASKVWTLTPEVVN